MIHEIYSDTLTQLLNSIHSQPSVERPSHIRDFASSFNPGDVVEIQGPPSSGKTHLLYHLLINCITPIKIFGGWQKAAVVFDTDRSFNITRFHHLVLGHLTRFLSSDIHSVKAIAQQSLARLHIFQPTSSLQLATTIYNLPKYHVAHLPNEEIGMLAIDSVSTYYWPDRFTVEQIMVSDTKKGYLTPLHHILTALQSFRCSHGSIILMTNWGLHMTGNNIPPTYKQHLHPFPAILANSQPAISHLDAPMPGSLVRMSLTCHITLSATSSPQLCQDICSKLAATSNEMIEKEEITALVRWPNSTTNVTFAFYITPDLVY